MSTMTSLEPEPGVDAVGHERPREMRVRTVNANTGLCDVCEAVDFRHIRLIFEDEKDEEGNVKKRSVRPAEHDLGFIDEILQTDCSLCRVVTAALRLNWSKVPVYTVSGERIRCFIPASNYTFPNPKESEHKSLRRNWELRIEIDIHDRLKHLERGCEERYPAAIRLDQRDSRKVHHPKGLYNLGRVSNRTEVNLSFLQESYRRCKESHGHACEKGHHEFDDTRIQLHLRRLSPLTQPRSFRLVDVVNYQVVEAPKGCEWVALSYCWGPKPFLNLNTANQTLLMSPQGLKLQEIPRTIQESITLVSALGEKYLWVDSLCILQDSESDKSSNILQMDKIFGFASLTIVAGDGDSVESGLIGYTPGSRNVTQHHELVHGLRFIAMRPALSALIPTLSWSKRAWTLQENELSKRLMIFTAEQCFFLCAAEPEQEDSFHYTEEYPSWFRSKDDRLKVAAVYGPEFPDHPWRSHASRHAPHNRAFLDERKIKGWAGITSYGTLVQDYSSRKLTCESDILSAVYGVLRSVAPFKHDHHLCGLPQSNLHWSLLWIPKGKLRRREEGNVQFPSWSWSGWVGPVGYDHWSSPEITIKPMVKGWTICLPSGVDAGEEEKSAYAEGILQSGGLCFNTQSANFLIETKYDPNSGYLIHRSLRGGGAEMSMTNNVAWFKIKKNDIWVGTVVLDMEFAKSHSEVPVDAEFVIISSGTRWGALITSGGDGWTNVDQYDKKQFPIRNLYRNDTQLPEMYNVMWIQRSGSVAYRVAVGQISSLAWANVDPIEEKIVLF